jgi:serine/threonine-protein kinase PknK
VNASKLASTGDHCAIAHYDRDRADRLCKNDADMARDQDGSRPFEVEGYRDVSQIGRGASSTVYKGYDPELSRWVAIKVLLTDDPDDPARKRFRREGEITANLGKHPHIVQVLGTGFTASGSPYVVMEFFEQGSIGDRLRSSGAFTVEQTLDIGEKIADAVSAAHRAGVLHRDIKPQNILLSEYGPALGDFGIARTSANLEWSQSLDQLTPMHAAPEVLLGGTSTVQSDLYALGSTLYAMLAGRPPFAGAPGEAPLRYQVRVVQEPVPPIPRADLPPSVVEAIECALAKSPADRYGSAIELRDVLRSCQHHADGVSPAPRSPAALMGVADPVTLAPPQEPFGAAIASLPQAPPVPAAPAAGDQTVTRARGGTDAPPAPPLPSAAVASAGATAPSPPDRPSGPHDVVTPLGDMVPAGGGGELTVQRPISTLATTATSGTPDADRGRRRRNLLVAAGASVVVVAAGVGALLLLGKPAPAKIPVKKEYTITTANTDKPADVKLVPTGTGAVLEWSDPAGGQPEFLVYEIGSTGSKIAGVTPAGTTRFSLPGVDPASTRDCFEVRARVNKHTVGAPAQWCPSSESVSGS